MTDKFDKASYDKQYASANIVRKFLPFNRSVPEDMEMLQWLEQQPNFTRYIKHLIRKDMEEREP